MKFRQDDLVYTTYAGSRSSLIGRVVGLQPRNNGMHYTVSLTFDSKPNTLTLILHEDKLTLTEEMQYKRLIEEIALGDTF